MKFIIQYGSITLSIELSFQSSVAFAYTSNQTLVC